MPRLPGGFNHFFLKYLDPFSKESTSSNCINGQSLANAPPAVYKSPTISLGSLWITVDGESRPSRSQVQGKRNLDPCSFSKVKDCQTCNLELATRNSEPSSIASNLTPPTFPPQLEPCPLHPGNPPPPSNLMPPTFPPPTHHSLLTTAHLPLSSHHLLLATLASRAIGGTALDAMWMLWHCNAYEGPGGQAPFAHSAQRVVSTKGA
jgi:hypothetical protein